MALTLRLQPLSCRTRDAELEATYLKALAGFEGALAAWEGATEERDERAFVATADGAEDKFAWACLLAPPIATG